MEIPIMDDKKLEVPPILGNLHIFPWWVPMIHSEDLPKGPTAMWIAAISKTAKTCDVCDECVHVYIYCIYNTTQNLFRCGHLIFFVVVMLLCWMPRTWRYQNNDPNNSLIIA
jgi:hypothetical protein